MSAVDLRFIPSYEGQTFPILTPLRICPIHPLLRRAASMRTYLKHCFYDSSLPTKGRHFRPFCRMSTRRFIPSYEGRTRLFGFFPSAPPIHPLLRGADGVWDVAKEKPHDSSPPTRGRHSVFMRLSAALNTSLCNLHKCRFRLVHIFNMPKNPPHFYFFSNYFLFFSTPITRDIPAPYDLDRPTPFLIKFRNAFASLTRSRNSYPNTLTG